MDNGHASTWFDSDVNEMRVAGWLTECIALSLGIFLYGKKRVLFEPGYKLFEETRYRYKVRKFFTFHETQKKMKIS